MISTAQKRGVTLLEVTITVAIMGIIAAVTVLAARHFDPIDPLDPHVILADSLRVTLETGAARGIRFVEGDDVISATVLPDGSIVADSLLHTERLSGMAHNAR